MNPIATRRNVKRYFRLQPRNVIVRAQKPVSTEYKKCGISEDLNQNDDRVISQKFEQYQRFLHHHMNRQTENRFSSCSILNLKTLFKFVSQCNLVPFLESRLCNVENELDNCDFAVV